MDAGSPGRQQQRTTVVLDRSPVRSAGPGGPCRRTQEQLAIRVSGGPADFLVCNRCGQISHNLSTCDFCLRDIPATATAKTRSVCPKRRLNLDGVAAINSGNASTGASQPVDAKLSKRVFYGVSAAVPAAASNHHVLTLRQPPASTNGQASRPVLSAVARQPPQPAAPKRTVPAPTLRRGKREPECLTISISSDEEAETEGGREERHRPSAPEEGPPAKENHARGGEQQQTVVQETPPQSPRGGSVAAVASPLPPSRGGAVVEAATMRFSCRSIRIGSYKVAAGAHWVTASETRGFEFAVRPPGTDAGASTSEVALQLGPTDVVQVLGHLARNMGVVFVETTRECSVRLRSQLGMASRKMPCYFDPQGDEECQKRITFLPEPPLSEEQKAFLRTKFPGPLLREIRQTQANEILIRSSPSPALLSTPAIKTTNLCSSTSSSSQSEAAGQSSSSSITHVMIHTVPGAAARITRSAAAASPQGSSQENDTARPNLKLLVYPPPPRTGGIAVHSADLRCLREGQFLNDVIIDFYLKYLVLERLSEEVRQRTHVFSSFFYPRLTQRLNRALGPAGLSPAARRHRNVRTWTRHVDIFSKDFIVVPINQNAHWFLAVVCFPGLVARTCPPQEIAAEQEQPFHAADSPASPRTPPAAEMNLEDSEGILDSDPDDGTELEEPEPAKGSAAEATTERAYILILDSLRGGQGGKCRIMTMLREYLSEEWKAKKRSQLTFCYGNMRGYTPRTPQQGNYSDCGVYLLQYVESFLESPPRVGEAVLQERSNWFPETRVAHKRTAIRDLILELHMQQHPHSDFPQRWRQQEEEEEAAAAQCLQLDDPVPATTTTTTLLVTPVPANTVILVCPTQPPS